MFVKIFLSDFRSPGHSIPALLEAILKLMPLDTYVENPVALMDRVPADKARDLPVPVWDTYQQIVDRASGKKVLCVKKRLFFRVGERARQMRERGKEWDRLNLEGRKNLRSTHVDTDHERVIWSQSSTA